MEFRQKIFIIRKCVICDEMLTITNRCENAENVCKTCFNKMMI